MDYVYVIICFLIFLLVDYFTIPFYVKKNKDLFWSLYHDKIIKVLSKDLERWVDDE